MRDANKIANEFFTSGTNADNAFAGAVYNFKSASVTAPSEALVTPTKCLAKQFMSFWV